MTIPFDDYDEIYSQDFQPTGPHGWIQWKGTNVCVDLYCSCGHHGHVDADFFYHYECPKCHAKYAVGQNIALIPLTPEQAENHKDRFVTCDLEED